MKIQYRIKKIKDSWCYDYRYYYLYQIKILGYWMTYKTRSGELVYP